MSNSRIPLSLVKFIIYLNSVNAYLNTVAPGDSQKRGLVLGMSQEDLDKLEDFVKLFMSGDPAHPGLWDLHSNADTKNRKTRQDMLSGISEFVKFFRPILNKIAISPLIVNGDRLKLNIAAPVTSHTVPTDPIAENCFVTLSTQIGCIIKYRCRKTADASRASKPANADGVEIAYRSDIPELEAAEKGNELSSKVKRNILKSSTDGTTKAIFTRASFRMQLPEEQVGNYFQFFARWINTKHRGLDGPWTGPFNVTIS
jgi:hypothetical protein